MPKRVPLSFTSFSSLQGAAARRWRPDGIFIIKKYYSWPKGCKGGVERGGKEGEGGGGRWDEGGKKVAERGNKWGITSGTEVAELISKTRAE